MGGATAKARRQANGARGEAKAEFWQLESGHLMRQFMRRARALRQTYVPEHGKGAPALAQVEIRQNSAFTS